MINTNLMLASSPPLIVGGMCPESSPGKRWCS